MKKPCAPKPLRETGEISRLAITLDIPKECQCKMQIQCAAGLPGYPEICPGQSKCNVCHPGGKPCQHVIDAAIAAEEFFGDDWDDADKCREQFLAILTLARPADHGDPPLPTPRITLSHESRISLYSVRVFKGQQLFHPDDKHQFDEIDVQMVKGKKESGIQSAKGKE